MERDATMTAGASIEIDGRFVGEGLYGKVIGGRIENGLRKRVVLCGYRGGLSRQARDVAPNSNDP